MHWVMPRTIFELFHQWEIKGSLACQKILWKLSLFVSLEDLT